jgi:hypothetical protein
MKILYKKRILPEIFEQFGKTETYEYLKIFQELLNNFNKQINERKN